jgi:DNA replication protein DnaC
MPPARLEQGSGALRSALDDVLAAARRQAAGPLGAGSREVAPDEDVCADCGGRGWVIVPDGGSGAASRCPCSLRELLPRLEAEAGIPSRYQSCLLDKGDRPGMAFQARQHTLRAALETTRRWVDEYLAGAREGGLIFVGPPGVGKTHLAAAALSEVIRRYRVRGRFVDFTSLIYQIQSTFDSGNPETKQGVLEPVISAEVLVLDELGAQKPTAWVSEILYLVLNGRYTARRPTLFTTNYPLEGPSGPSPLDRGAGGDLLSSRIPAMLVSRLWEMGRPVVMMGDDFRREVKSHQHR